MDFAKNLLGKYGWKEGDGLGRNSDGISKPLKANYKFNNNGLGYNQADEMNNRWWENMYNKAAANLNVATNESGGGICVQNSGESIEISTKGYSLGNLGKEKESNYSGSFLKSSTLTNEGREVEDANKPNITSIALNLVSDEDFFKACEGRTAHKGARHGLNLSGKLKRLEAQDKEFMQKMETTDSKKKCAKEKPMNPKILKRLNKREEKKLRKSEKRINELSSAFSKLKSSDKMEAQRKETERIEAERKIAERKEEKKRRKEEKAESKKRRVILKVRAKKLKNKERKRNIKEYLKRNRNDFLKPNIAEKISITPDGKSNKHHSTDNVTFDSYRDQTEQSESDNDDATHLKVSKEISQELKNNKNKDNLTVVNLTEFQAEQLSNADLPYVMIKRKMPKKDRKNREKVNSLAKRLEDEMSIL